MNSLNMKQSDDANDELIANEKDEVDDNSYSNCEAKSEALEEGSSAKIINSLNVFNPPALFNILLQKRTNLNEPPSNWLHGSSRWQRNVNQGSFPFGNFFSSLNMANQFLDLTGIVDVISDSKNIKKLLKMTLSKANVSMIVHRVNNTLLLDNFDIHSLLKEKTGPWELFRRFYFEKVAEDVKLSVVERKNKSRDHLQSQNMFSKLLYYCLADGQQSPDSIPDVDSHHEPDSNILSQRTVVWNFEDIRMLIGTDLPIFGGGTHPCVSLKLRDMRKPISVLTGLDNWLDNLMCNVPDLAMCYHDNGIVQSYEVLKTEDIPNCPDCRFSPNVIKDIAQNILSFLKSNATKEGHTYWLFKAHDGDIVKLYDLTTLCCNDDDDDAKTSEPVENPFTIPVGVLFYRLARNLRIRQKCPSRGKKAMVVRQLLQNSLLLLEPCKHYQVIASCHYFLSDLFVCDHLEEEPSDSESSESDIDLSPQADLCDEKKEAKTSKNKKGFHNSRNGTSFIRVEALSRHRKSNKKQSHLNKKKDTLPKDDKVSADDGIEDPFKNFLDSLDHISQTFKNVDRFHSFMSNDSSGFYKKTDGPKSKTPQPFEELAQCNPNEAIPLHYSPLKPTSLLKSSQVDVSSDEGALKSCGEVCEKKQSLAKSLKDIESPFSNTSIDASHWLEFSKIFLLRKAAVVFIKRAKLKFEISKNVDASLLQDGFNAVRCYCAFSKKISSTFPTFGSSKQRKSLSEDVHRKCCHDPFLFSCISKVLGDAYLKLATCDFHSGEEMIPSDEEQNVLDLVESYITPKDVPFSLQVSDNQRESFAQCLVYYRLAQSIAEDFDLFSFSSAKRNLDGNVPKFVTDLLKRKANVCNEYGKFLVREVFLAGGSLKDDWFKELDRAQENYRESYNIFKQLNDKTNAALVLLNETNSFEVKAKIIRKTLIPDEQTQFSEKERTAYQQAEACLMEGLSLLENRKKDKDLYDAFMWELASINVEAGCLLQDCLSVGSYSEESVKNMMDYFNKALKFSTFEKNSNKHELSLYRKGHIHHRLGAFYLRHTTNEKQHPSIEDLVDAYKHYEISINLFVSVKADVELLKVLLEKIVLLEMTTGGEMQLASRLESAFDVLETLLKSSGPMNDIVNILQETSSKLSKPSGSPIDTDDLICDLRNISELVKLCDCIRNKLSSVLLCLVKLCRMRSGECKQFAHMKTMYNKCLLSKAISFPWNIEMQNWTELATKVKSIQKCVIYHNSESNSMNVYTVEDNSKLEDLSKMETGLKSEDSKSIIMPDPLVVIPFSKVQELLSACRSLAVLLSDFQAELPLAKFKK